MVSWKLTFQLSMQCSIWLEMHIVIDSQVTLNCMSYSLYNNSDWVKRIIIKLELSKMSHDYRDSPLLGPAKYCARHHWGPRTRLVQSWTNLFKGLMTLWSLIIPSDLVSRWTRCFGVDESFEGLHDYREIWHSRDLSWNSSWLTWLGGITSRFWVGFREWGSPILVKLQICPP